MIHPIEKSLHQRMKQHHSSSFLLAVSGGVDSIVLLQALKNVGASFQVAHCNFGLRGEESEKDFLFVKQICLQHEIKFHGTKFETADYAKSKGISIQMAARELRYQWFQQILIKEKINYLITAHHQDDQIETILLNVIRGKGNYSWEGMMETSKNIIRPLLHFTKQELIEYAKANQLQWREDSSNEKSDYQRNYIRNIALPELSKHFPGIENNLLNFARINRYNNQVLRHYFSDKQHQLIRKEEDKIIIDGDALLKEDDSTMLLFQLIQSFGFNIENCEQMMKTLSSSGKKFYSTSHTALINRETIILSKSDIPLVGTTTFSINDKHVQFNNFKFEWTIIPNQQINLKTNLKSIAFIDYSKLTGPLEWRTYRTGDFFHPLGMKGKKLLSDFFIDEKIDDFSKKQIPLLCNKEDIVWIAGYRIDDRYKVTDDTTSILRIDMTTTN